MAVAADVTKISSWNQLGSVGCWCDENVVMSQLAGFGSAGVKEVSS